MLLTALAAVAADGFRGWGGQAQAAETCWLGASIDHPTQHGFRVTMRDWARDTIVECSFDTPVTLARHWGPVRALTPVASRTLAFVLRRPPATVHTRSGRRTDQWGFVLQRPYEGTWRIACQRDDAATPLATAFDLPTVSAIRAPNASEPVALDTLEEGEDGEDDAEDEDAKRPRGKRGSKANSRQRTRQRRRRRRKRRAKKNREE